MHVISKKTAPACFPPIWRKRNPNSVYKHWLYRILLTAISPRYERHHM
jgi:hypothetical protein